MSSPAWMRHRARQARAVAAVGTMAAIATVLAQLAARAAGDLDAATATVEDLIVIAAASLGAACATALVVSALALSLAPARSRVRRLATSVTPEVWRRIVVVAATGTAAAGVALPAGASTALDPTSGSAGEGPPPASAGWLTTPSTPLEGAGWIARPSPSLAPTADAPAQHRAAPAPLDMARAIADSPPQTPRESAQPPSTHVVEPGESLWAITAQYVGGSHSDVAAAWPELYARNAALIGADPAVIHPGETLAIPAGWSR
jgi:hypothetical protein